MIQPTSSVCLTLSHALANPSIHPQLSSLSRDHSSADFIGSLPVGLESDWFGLFDEMCWLVIAVSGRIADITIVFNQYPINKSININ